jgi:hypothetical protein
VREFIYGLVLPLALIIATLGSIVTGWRHHRGRALRLAVSAP